MPYSKGTVISKDGTVVGYRQVGSGPGLILLHGGLQAAQDLMMLAEELSTSFAVYIPDRRGRGLSGRAGEGYGLGKECEDLEALLRESEAHRIFGLSSGGIVALYAALTLQAIRQIAVYEPPLSSHSSTPLDWTDRYRREIEEGELPSAFVTVLKGTRTSPFLQHIPRIALVPIMKWASRRDRNQKQGDVSLIQLIPTMELDIRLVRETENTIQTLASLEADSLLLGGSRSPSYLRQTLRSLEQILPRTKRVEFKGLDHLGPSNGGNPRLVATALKAFFAEI